MRNQPISLLVLIIFLFISLLGFNHSSQAQLRCEIEQLTFNTQEPSERNAIAADGSIMAFTSEDDLIGQNPNFRTQIFYYDILNQSFTQVTTSDTNSSFFPSVSGDGILISFNTFFGSDSQVFVHNRAAGTTTQVTNDPGVSDDTYVNTLGTNVTFESDADINGGNPGGQADLFQYNIITGVINQLTDIDVNFLQGITSNFNGNLTSFSTFGNITGQNPGGQSQVYIYDVNTDSISQITFGVGDSRAHRFGMDGSGNLLAFNARSNPSAGGAFFGNQRLFLYDGTQGTFQQLTSDFDTDVGAINEDGTCVVFPSREDFTGQNPLNNQQLFIYDIPSGEYTQVGNNMTTSGIRTPTPSADCSIIAFTSIGSFTEPERMNEEQVYLATCGIQQVPTLSEWGLIAMAAILGIVGFMVIRRRQAVA